MFRLPGLLVAIVIHEFSHGCVAYALGDNTAKDSGRLTLNPLKHIDLIGFIFYFYLNLDGPSLCLLTLEILK